MSTSKSVSEQLIPYLESGDRLSRDEFERRYAAMPNVKKAELIEAAAIEQAEEHRLHYCD